MNDDLHRQIEAIDWDALERDIGAHGYAVTPALLTPAQCKALAALFDDDRPFRRRVVMTRHGYGSGTYAYFGEPLPPIVEALRAGLYAPLAPIAERMMSGLGQPTHYPDSLAEFRRHCAAAGQSKPTPLLLRYGAGDFNCLHRDLYGDIHFPLQAAAVLSRIDEDYTGGEFLLVENRPRQQARGTALRLEQGRFVVFPVYSRPVPGKRSVLRAQMRHGVSPIRSGTRFALGIIFHDAA